MSGSGEQALPAKCKSCNRPMSTPLVCDYCAALDPAAMATDYFTLLGLPQRFDIDEARLHKKYLALSRHAHPDYHADEGPEVQQLHLRVSAALNDAYNTLRDPARRAACLLVLFGG